MKPLMVAAPAEATDDELVAAAQQGSDAAFEALFRRYRDRITAYVRGIVSDHARAEDIVQDAFMSALRSLRANQREVAFKPWIYEIAKNACIDHIRRTRRTSEVSIDSEDFSPVDEGRLSAAVASTDAAYSARESLDTLRMAFNDLPTAQREVLVSRELEGLSYDSISSRTGLSRSAVESMLFRARRTLKDGFDDIATGERCQRMQTVMNHLTDGRIGLRQERRLVRHLRDCASCRREAIALGLDDLALGAPSRAQAAMSRLAAFLPLPAFLRRRWLDGAGLVGSAGPGSAEQGLSLAGKAAVVLAAAAIAGGGAGVAHKTGALGAGGSSKATPAARDGGGSGDGASSGGSPAGRVAGGAGSANAPGAGRGGANGGPGGRRGAGGDSAGPLGSAGGLGNGAGSVGSVAGDGAGGGANGVSGALDGAGRTANGALGGAGGTVDNSLKGAGDKLGSAGGSLTGPVTKTVPGTTGGNPVGGATDAVKQTVGGVTGTATGAVGGLTSPTQPAPAPNLGL